MATSVTPAPPRPPEGVGHDHADVDAEEVLQARPDAAGGEVGVLGEERGGALVDVGQVDPRIGADEAVARLADEELAAAAEDPYRLLFDQRAFAAGSSWSSGDEAALGLGHDLLRDDEHVAAAEVGTVAACGARASAISRPRSSPR